MDWPPQSLDPDSLTEAVWDWICGCVWKLALLNQDISPKLCLLKKNKKKKQTNLHSSKQFMQKKTQKLTVKLRMSGFVTVLLTAIRKNHPNNTKV